MQTRSRNYIIASAALFLLVLGIVRVNLIYKLQLVPIMRSHRAIQIKETAVYKKDSDDLEAHFPLKPVVFGKSDAGEVLNEQVVWTPRTGNEMSSKNHKHVKIRVDDGLRRDLIRYGNQYLEHPSHFTSYRPDFSIFARLGAYDHWDIESHSPISRLIEKVQFVPPNELPTPDPLDLISFAKLRLLKAADEPSIVPALHDVRELARLMITTENAQLITAGLSILEDERYAFYYYLKTEAIERDAWIPISGRMLSEARRAFDGTEGYLHIWTDIGLLDEIFLKSTPPVGFCSALNNQLPAMMSLRDYLEPHLPFEIDFRNEYRKVDQIVAVGKKHCRLRYMSELIRKDSFPAELPGLRVINRAPYWRKLFAFRASLADYSNFESYEKLKVISHQIFDAAPAERVPADD